MSFSFFGEDKLSEMFDENGKYIPKKIRYPYLAQEELREQENRSKKKEAQKRDGQPKSKRENKQRNPKNTTYGISRPLWTKPSPEWKKILEEHLKPIFKGEEKYPQRIPDYEKMKEAIVVNGFYQIGYGKEFIERSYALARRFEGLFKKEIQNYDSSTGEYFFDSKLKLFWRYTGFFD